MPQEFSNHINHSKFPLICPSYPTCPKNSAQLALLLEVMKYSSKWKGTLAQEPVEDQHSQMKGPQFCFEFSLAIPTIKCKKVVMQLGLVCGWSFHSFFLDSSMRNRLNIPSSALSLFLQKPRSVRLVSKTKATSPNVHSRFPKNVEAV